MATSKPNPQRKQPRPGAKPAGRKKPARRVDASRRSLAVLAAVCALALAAGFLLLLYGVKSVSFSIGAQRCDTYRIRIDGIGQATIYTLAQTTDTGSELE